LAVYATLFAAASLLTLYLGISWVEWRLIEIKWLEDLSLPQGIFLFVLHIILACVYGALFGEIKYNYYTVNTPRNLYNSWDYAFKYVFQSGGVILKTTTGTWVHGEVVQSGSSDETQDLLFESAHVLDPKESNKISVTPDGGTTPQIQYTDENISLRDSTESFADMDELLSENQIETAEADNYVYIDESSIETLVFCGGTGMDPAAEIGDKTPGAVEELFLTLPGNKPKLPDILVRLLRKYGPWLLGAVAVVTVISLPVFSRWLNLPDHSYMHFSFFTGAIIALTRAAYHQTDIFGSINYLSNVKSDISERLYRTLAVVTAGLYVLLIPPTIVPLLVGIVVGTTLTTVHLGVSERFDARAASYSLALASIPILITAVWVRSGMTSLFGRVTTLVWAITVVAVVIDRLWIGTPSSYDGWPDVVRYTVWWGVTVLVSVGLVAVAFGVNVPAVRVVTVVLLIVGWSLARSLRQTVQTDMS
jgi:hypothetical protein